MCLVNIVDITRRIADFGKGNRESLSVEICIVIPIMLKLFLLGNQQVLGATALVVRVK